MVSKKNKAELRQKKHARIRNRLSGTPERPRLAVFRSNKHMYAQLICISLCTSLTVKRPKLATSQSCLSLLQNSC